MQSVILCGTVVLQDKAALSAPFAMSEDYSKSHCLLEFTIKTLLLTLCFRGELEEKTFTVKVLMSQVLYSMFTVEQLSLSTTQW